MQSFVEINSNGFTLGGMLHKGVGHMFESLEARVKKLGATLEFLKKELLNDKLDNNNF